MLIILYDTIVSFRWSSNIPKTRLSSGDIEFLKPGGKAYDLHNQILIPPFQGILGMSVNTAQGIDWFSAGNFLVLFKLLAIGGNDKVWITMRPNRKSVQKIMPFDIFDLQYSFACFDSPNALRILNRLNPNKLHKEARQKRGGIISWRLLGRRWSWERAGFILCSLKK